MSKATFEEWHTKDNSDEISQSKELLTEERKPFIQKKFICAICNKGFKSKSYLQKHIQYCTETDRKYTKKNINIKNKIRKYMCELCGLAFHIRSTLVNHCSTHTQKAYSCDICMKRFTRSHHLRIHQRIHNNVRPYVCELCGHSFTKSSDLNRHRVVHSDVRKHSCKLCTKTFKRSGDIVSHMRLHTGDRPYACDKCEKTYKSNSSLRKHKGTHKELLKDELHKIEIN